MDKKSSVLIYGSNLGAHRASFAHCKNGHKVVFLNPGSYVDDKKNQALSQLPFDFCWICGHMPQRLFKALGCLTDNYNAEILSISGEGGNFKVKFKKRDQLVNNFACTECVDVDAQRMCFSDCECIDKEDGETKEENQSCNSKSENREAYKSMVFAFH